jgi:hypothetical protein
LLHCADRRGALGPLIIEVREDQEQIYAMIPLSLKKGAVVPFTVALLLQFAVGCSPSGKPDSGSVDKNLFWDKAKELYDKAKRSGETVPEDISDWMKEDIQKAGDWEYKIVTVGIENDADIERTLNELGAERWECFWIGKSGENLRLFMKRTAVSYLRGVPMRDLLKLVPQEDSNE